MKKIIKTLAIAGGVLCIAKGFDNRIETTEYKISSKKLPKEFDGFTIVQISDFHCDTFAGIGGEIKQLNPDIIVSTGDLADDKGSYAPAVRLCNELTKIAPMYAVTGNHDVWRGDYSQFEKELTALGVKTLHNERVNIERGGEYISLSGIDDPFAISNDNITENVQNSLAQLPHTDLFDILLFHRANLLDEIKHYGFDLILAGHMHGGQVRLPWGSGVFAPRSSVLSGKSMLFPKYFGGKYTHKHTTMIVNRGLGNPMVIPRLFNRPEITAITLKSE